MKRSEVIEILVNKFKSGEIPEPHMWANDILDILERSIGMNPPFGSTIKQVNIEDKWGRITGTRNERVIVAEWEKEDEM